MSDSREDIGTHPTAQECYEYLLDYAKHFDLQKHTRTNTDISKITRDHDRKQWKLHIAGCEAEYFDKVVIANGMNSVPKLPKIEELAQFKGRVMHSRSFKRCVHD